MKNAIFDSSRKRHFWLISAGFSDLGVNFWAPKLAWIDPAMEAAIVRHELRNISALRAESIGADRPELQCKMRDFQNDRLWGQFSPSSGADIWNPVDHVVYPPSSTPGKWNFWAISSENNVSPVGGQNGPIPYLAYACT